MNLITVIPLTRSKFVDELTYFTASEVPVGAIVSVPIRSKSVHAIVTEVRPAADLKTEIKSAAFAIRKLDRVRANRFFPASFMHACAELADYYATNIGAVIDTLVSDLLLENASKLRAPAIPAAPTADETYAVQGDDQDRISSWRSLIRQEFARKRSVAFYVPTLEEARSLFASLEKGIEGYIFVLNGKLAKKALIETWEKVASTVHPVIIIATGSFSVLPRSDIDTVVIERENGRGWIAPKTPYLDLRRAIESLARRNRQNVYLADCLLRTETLYRLSRHEISEGSPFKWRSISNAKDSLIDMRAYKSSENGFRIISPELDDLIRRNQEESGHLFIMAARRGMATSVVCDDCETIVTCRECGAPIVLHASKTGTANFFMCHRCGSRRSAEENCVTCGGWRLNGLGIGTERVAEDIASRHPGAEVFVIDADTAKTEKQIAEALARFRAKPGSILVGTEVALLHLDTPVEHAAIASFDSLFALPDFRISEKIMYALIRLRALATRSLLVQTRRPEEKAFEYGLKGNLSDFNRAILEERRQFGYPPFTTLIKLSLEGPKDRIANDMAAFVTMLEPREVDVFPAFTSAARGGSVIHGLIKIEPTSWPADRELLVKLKSLPPHASVKVDPESLL